MPILLLTLTLLSILLVSLVKAVWKGYLTLFAVLVNTALSTYIAVNALYGHNYEEIFYGGPVFGEIPVKIDALGAWFILLMNFTTLTGILYGRQYLSHYHQHPPNVSIHYASYIAIHFSMLGIYAVQNSLAFLCIWELMAICSFFLIVFEHEKVKTIKAGINFLVQAHIGIVFLMLGFIYVHSHTGSFDFAAINLYSATAGNAVNFVLFLCFFIGFATKAGFVPFHTWLPYAHPAAPAHVSGMMSGVIIKLGIFGILKMLLLIKGNYLLLGYIILILSVISGLYGVMLAIVQHNVKKLLAYHSIENIGIIGIGIGVGSIGLGLNNSWLAFTGFAGALLHTLNHSLFKSLLFYVSGTVYQATHTMNIEKLGGLIKKMPQSATLFLVASMAICGLPPFNGFISEFLIYSGLFHGINSARLSSSLLMIFSIFGLVTIGGLAMLCFTKAFGIIFLGTERSVYPHAVKEAGFSTLFPNYLIALLIVGIGVVPQFFLGLILKPVSLFTGETAINTQGQEFISILQTVSMAVWGFILLSMVLFGIKKWASSKVIATSPTWGCGYIAPSAKLQYTANSFVRSYRKLAKPLLMMNKKDTEIKSVFPEPVHTHTNPYDKIEAVFIDLPIKHLKRFMRSFRFLQNGNPQFYILYGVIFILLAIGIPLLSDAVNHIIALLNKLT